MRLNKYLTEKRWAAYTVFFDMDGTLSDFAAAFKKIDGRTTQEVEKEGDPAFWAHVKKGGLEFWSEMPWMKGSKKLWNYVYSNRTSYDVEILTAPARALPDSKKGKKIWVKRELGNVPITFIRAKNKHKYAKENHILIDDMKSNIDAWKKAGGIGILFKTPSQAIKEFKKIINGLSETI
jgi:FMN phosphatase YigB (HAD superfamily)